MNNPILMLAAGVLVGVLVGRSLKQCEAAAPTHATTGDVLAGLVGLGGKVVNLFHTDDPDKR